MIGSKAGAAGAKRSCRQSTKRKLDLGGVAGVFNSGNKGFGVSGEWKEVADVKFLGVRDSSIIVEIKHYVKGHNVYTTVKEGKLVAAIIHDVFRLCVDLSYPEESLNIRNVGLCIQKEIQKEAQIELTPIGKRFLVECMKRHLVKLSDDSPDAQFPLKLEGLTNEKFGVLKEKIIKLARQCFRDLKEKIIADYGIQGRQRMDEDIIPPYLPLPEDNGSLEEGIQDVKDRIAKVVAKLAPSNGKLMDEKIEAIRRDLITLLEVARKKLEPVDNLDDGAPSFITSEWRFKGLA